MKQSEYNETDKMHVAQYFCAGIEYCITGILSSKSSYMVGVDFFSDDKSENTKCDNADMKLESFNNFEPESMKFWTCI